MPLVFLSLLLGILWESLGELRSCRFKFNQIDDSSNLITSQLSGWHDSYTDIILENSRQSTSGNVDGLDGGLRING